MAKTIWAAVRAVLCILAGHAIAITPLFEMPVRGLALIIAPLFAGLFAGASRHHPVLLGALCCAVPSSLVMHLSYLFTPGEELSDNAGAGSLAIVGYSVVVGAIVAKIASRTPANGVPNEDENQVEAD